MKRILVALIAVSAFVISCVAQANDQKQKGADLFCTQNLMIEALENPVGIESTTPRMSWKTEFNSVPNESAIYNKRQSAYQILVASSLEKLEANDGDLWDSGKVQSEDSLFVDYAGKPLQTLKKYFWKVRVWDENDQPLDWSRPAFWVQGVVAPNDWKGEWIAQPESVRPNVDLDGANWIAAQKEQETNSGFATEYFRKEFTLDRPQSDFDEQNLSAILYFAANQKFNIFVNGRRVGYSIGMVFNADILRSIDVSEYLAPGKNVVAFSVSNDTKNSNDTKANNGELRPTALVAKLFVRALDKSNAPDNLQKPNRFGAPADLICAVATDPTWKATLEEKEGWNGLEFDDSNWASAKYAAFVKENGKSGLDDGPWGKLRRRTETVSPAFQKSFTLKKKVKDARLAVCAPGLFEFYLDDQRIGDQLLTPSFTRYDKRILYNVFDLAPYLQDSTKEHELQFLLGHSWYDVRSIVTWNFDAAPWRDFPKMRAMLDITYDDGTQETIVTDDSWSYSTSPVLFDCVRQGEIINGAWKREILGNAVVVDAPIGNPKLVAQKNPTTVVTDQYVAKSVKEVRPNVYVVDMGRNSAGWARVKIHGQKPGDVIRFKYSERVLESGEIERHDIEMHFMEGTPYYVAGMKGEFQTDFYFCNGNDEEYFEPRFTYNGYQYIEVTGLRNAPSPEDFVGQRVNTNFKTIGDFASSSYLLNALQSAMHESYLNNFVAGYPTDCPHREKNGWTGDAQLACELAQYNFENTAAYEKWVDDLVDEQREDGNLPGIVPTGDWGYPWGNGPAWDSSLVLIPWYLYVYRGDKKILEDAYDAMKKYVDYMTSRERENGIVYHGLGDWVSPKTNTPTEVTVSGYYYVDAKIVAQTAKLLGKSEDFAKYSTLAERIRKSYNAALYKGDGVYSIASQTSQSCPIHQGFTKTLPEKDQQEVFNRLVESVEKTNGHFDCGIFGVKYILRTLSENGRTDLALQLMLQKTKPAMSDWIERGAGTLWEDWGEGSSRNHIMFGDFSAWFYQSLAGIKLADAPDVVVAEAEPSALAFKRFVIEPKSRRTETTTPDGNSLTSAQARMNSPYGQINSSWNFNKETGETTYSIRVPFNTTASVVLPIEEGQKCIVGDGAKFVSEPLVQNGAVAFEIGSGYYTFVVK